MGELCVLHRSPALGPSATGVSPEAPSTSTRLKRGSWRASMNVAMSSRGTSPYSTAGPAT
ncbi:hypothetical protein AB0K14_40540 [Actinosynnema sp. NPDC050801]|uniref:hypothetical protein n=1 Tax=Actinosynnema sp. NPDC050801 TaxID=3155663 RepID=UPI00344685DE